MQLQNNLNYNNYNYLAPINPSSKEAGVESCEKYYSIKPQEALEWSFDEALDKLSNLIGSKNVNEILSGKKVDSPVSKNKNSEWMKQSNIVGVNPRALGTYFDIVKYAMTFPEDSVHLLPLFEQGCQSSLYAPVNFKLSDEFMDDDLTRLGFDTPEKQLKLAINFLHALNKNVGMDFLQHTDRFSQEVFINPDNFTWAKLDEFSSRELQYPEINPDKLGDEVKELVVDFISKNGDSKGKPVSEKILSNFYNLPENSKRRILFGDNAEKRRIALMNFVRENHFETKPLSIDDPRRKISFKEMMSNEKASWATFTDNMDDKIFGNLAAYKLYHLNENGEVDTSRPNCSAWDFLVNKTVDFQKEYGFDFLRADMGYLSFGEDKRDIHAVIKQQIQNYNPSFATFGECFAGFSDNNPREIEAKNYDAVLGNLQYENVYDYNFLNKVKDYNFSNNKIAITSITTDSDQACYNQHYDNFQNKIRTFLGMFLNQPSYMGMGLETRDVNPTDGKNLTKDFINDWGIEKYEWGKNQEFFDFLSGARKVYSSIKNVIKNQLHYWLWTNDNKVASWFYHNENKTPSYLFVTNTDNNYKDEVEIQNVADVCDKEKVALKDIYSSEKKKLEAHVVIKGKKVKVTNLAPGECRIYKVVQ